MWPQTWMVRWPAPPPLPQPKIYIYIYIWEETYHPGLRIERLSTSLFLLICDNSATHVSFSAVVFRLQGIWPQTTDANVWQKESWGRTIFWVDRGLDHSENNKLESTSYLLPLSSKTSFTELYGNPAQTPTLPILPCCALFCNKIWICD